MGAELITASGSVGHAPHDSAAAGSIGVPLAVHFLPMLCGARRRDCRARQGDRAPRR